MGVEIIDLKTLSSNSGSESEKDSETEDNDLLRQLTIIDDEDDDDILQTDCHDYTETDTSIIIFIIIP